MPRKSKNEESARTNNSLDCLPPILFKPLTINQNKYSQSIDKNIITLTLGPAGSGKTAVACAKAVDHLRRGAVERIVVTRPALESGNKLGFIPGTLNEKFFPFCIPLSEEFDKFSTPLEIKVWKSANKIQYLPTAYLRGYNLNNTFIIADECASFTFDELILIITRIGKNSKLIMLGDVLQSDLSRYLRGSFSDIFAKLSGMNDIGTITLTKEDIVRHGLIAEILERLLEN